MKRKLETVKIEDHSFEINSEEELLSAFRKQDLRKVVLQGALKFPVKSQHYLAWREASGNYVYLVFKRPEWEKPKGIVFKRPSGNPGVAIMCDWCLSVGSMDEVGMLSVSLNSNQSIGIILCSDLGCIGRLQEVSLLSGKNFDKLANQLYEKIARLYETILRAERKISDPSESLHS